MKSKNTSFWVGISFVDVPTFYIHKNMHQRGGEEHERTYQALVSEG